MPDDKAQMSNQAQNQNDKTGKEFIEFVGFVEFVEFIGFVEFVGFVELYGFAPSL
jgi:hypothetical protein